MDKPKVPIESLEAHVDPELISAVTKLLDDRNPQVRVAAAITLYSLKKHNDNVSFTKCLCDFLTSYTDLLSGHHGIFLLGWKDCVTHTSAAVCKSLNTTGSGLMCVGRVMEHAGGY